MKRRIQIIEETQPNLAVSIHQNSYGEEYVNGAQVFYYNGSVKSKELAEMIQNRMIQYLDPENHRQAKANDSYYLLKKRENRLLSWSAVFCPTAPRPRSFVIIIIRRR